MRQLTFIKPGVLEWWDVPAPRITSPLQAIVEPIAVASCDLDTPILRGEAPFRGPFAFGHEVVGRVKEVGEDVHEVIPGQQVVVPFQISCGTCAACLRGFTANCVMVPAFSTYGLGRGEWGGALSDLMLVPFADSMLVPVPAGISPVAIASASDNIPDAWRAIGPGLEEFPGAPVLILGGAGTGSIGLYGVALARALGAERVDYVDRDAGRLALAQKLGANVIEATDPLPPRFGSYPITMDACGDPAALMSVLRSTAPDGICTSTAIYFNRETALPLRDMYYSGVTFKTGRVHSRTTIPTILDLVRDARLQPELVTTELASWDEAAEALVNFRTKLVISRAD
ncbi:MAG: alcohol dehydrogenase catalytic domain-containing protein [Ktedonobacteraceae bacterium]|nr:alcohol dehydrogenase catalytic domain-containing protein [Ktedonobacteraceae bacterium]